MNNPFDAIIPAQNVCGEIQAECKRIQRDPDETRRN
jgi:hypothetical protein